MIVSVVCAHFRDITQIVTNAVQVLFYLTPVIWNAEIMANRVGTTFLYGNPFYSLMTIALWFYGNRLKRVPYWL